MENVVTTYLSTKDLTSGAKYQRPVDRKKIEKIISTYDEHKLGIIKVSFRDGKYWVYDGQHRLIVIKAINNGMDKIIPCEVHHGLTYEEEARLFAEQYDGATKVDIMYQFNALYEAGNSEIKEIKEIAESEGFIINFTKYKGDFRIVAVSKLRDIYRRIGKDGLKTTLNLISRTWSGISSSLDKDILGGVSLFLSEYGDEVDSDTFIKNLSKVSPSEIKRNGKCDISTKKTDLKYAKQVFEAYNSGLRKKNKLEYKFRG